jgi:hypothetical protein
MDAADRAEAAGRHSRECRAIGRGPLIRHDDANVVCGAAQMEVLGNLLLVEETVVATAHRSQSLGVVCMFHTERDGLVICQRFDYCSLERKFERPAECLQNSFDGRILARINGGCWVGHQVFVQEGRQVHLPH